MRAFLLYLSMAAGLLTVGAAHAKPFTYVNERFGTSATFPDEIFSEQEEPPENGDGLRWLSKDGAEIAIYGSYNVMDDTPESLEASGKALPGRAVTYAKRGGNWVVLSGTENGEVFYERQVIGPTDIIHAIHITYPEVLKAKYDPLVGAIAKSLRGP